eukprot:6206456-Pleurochrysis_carterae.AAC.7
MANKLFSSGLTAKSDFNLYRSAAARSRACGDARVRRNKRCASVCDQLPCACTHAVRAGVDKVISCTPASS